MLLFSEGKIIECEGKKDIFESLRTEDIKKWECGRGEELIIDNYYASAIGPKEFMVINICEKSHYSFLFFLPNSVIAMQKQ